MWRHAQNAFTEVQTDNGIAHGTNGARNTYDDSYALLSGFGPDQSATATVRRNAQLAEKVTHEVELLLRMTDDSSGARGYECLFAFHGGVQIMRWNGPMGSFTDLGIQEGGGRFKRALKSGDNVKATVVGNAISLYVNGTLVGRTRIRHSQAVSRVSVFLRDREVRARTSGLTAIAPYLIKH